jgi:multiple sugar transport system permease protein
MAETKKNISHIIFWVVLILMAILTMFPLLWGIACSLRSDTEIFKYARPLSYHTFVPVKFSLDSYVRIFRDFKFQRPLLNTFYVSAVTIIAGCLINSIAAMAFAKFKFKGKKIIFVTILISFMIPFESITLPLYSVVNSFHWVDTYTGLIVPCLADGLVLFLFNQFFKDFPDSILEAAEIDGASMPEIYFRIILPLSMPVFVTAALMVFMNQWNAYLWPLVIARSPGIRLVQIAIASFKMERVTLWSCLYAASMISALIPVVFFLPFQKYYVQGITSSGIKG